MYKTPTLLMFIWVITLMSSCWPMKFNENDLTLRVNRKYPIQDINIYSFSRDSLPENDISTYADSVLTQFPLVQKSTFYLDQVSYCNAMPLPVDTFYFSESTATRIQDVCTNPKVSLDELRNISILSDTSVSFYRYNINEIIEDNLIEDPKTLREINQPNMIYEIKVSLFNYTYKTKKRYHLLFSTDSANNITVLKAKPEKIIYRNVCRKKVNTL